MKALKNFFKALDVAFSMYSKIPMPRFVWASEDMRYHLCFFPWVGAVIGLLEWAWKLLHMHLPSGQILYCAVAMIIPLLVTGGFHLDGFLDTMDALHSYQPKEKKLEILKDPHIGAFAVISLTVYLLAAAGAVSEIKTVEAVISVSFSFFISRALSGISVTYFPKAKKDGMLHTEASTEDRKFVGASLIFQAVLCAALQIYVTLPYSFSGVVSLSAMMAVFVYYYFMSKKEFGGITGDLSGFFVTVSELAAVIGVAVCCILGI